MSVHQIRPEPASAESASIPNPLPPAGPSDDQVAEAADRIGQIVDQVSLQLAVSVGQVVVDVFYGGDFELFRSRDPKKDVSLRKLADHPDVPYGASCLSRFVRVYSLYERLGTVVPGQQLSLSHYNAVLALPFEDQQVLLERAAAEGWNREQVQKAVAELREADKNSKGGGRPPLPAVVKVVRALHSTFKTKTELFGSLSNVVVDDLKVEDAQDICAKAQALAEQLQALVTRLQPMLTARDHELMGSCT